MNKNLLNLTKCLLTYKNIVMKCTLGFFFWSELQNCDNFQYFWLIHTEPKIKPNYKDTSYRKENCKQKKMTVFFQQDIFKTYYAVRGTQYFTTCISKIYYLVMNFAMKIFYILNRFKKHCCNQESNLCPSIHDLSLLLCGCIWGIVWLCNGFSLSAILIVDSWQQKQNISIICFLSLELLHNHFLNNICNQVYSYCSHSFVRSVR
eukprot:TRINITY_DN4438_c0_g2_i5.p3 TRINITY_DN4438_c0_g2~~TRINITY_DN4438_c0_g2_i5.p3  ORF type:complete len:205 (+),score=-15.46 TRINITY_DN4438_c0_g2_i5:2354-2968(+)